VRLRNAPAPAELQQLPGVAAVEMLDDGRLRLRYDGTNPAEAIAETAVTRQWGLEELIPERRTLEQIFIELTMQDVHMDAGTHPAETEAA